jgi:hypothetical protein
MTTPRSPYPFLPPLPCATCGRPLPPRRKTGYCFACSATKSRLRRGLEDPLQWGTAISRRRRILLWQDLTGQRLSDPYAPRLPPVELTTAATPPLARTDAPPPLSHLRGSSQDSSLEIAAADPEPTARA